MKTLKKFFYLLLLWLVIYPAVGSAARELDITAVAKRLHTDVQALTSIRPYRNYQNTDSLDQAAAYIFKEFGKSTGRTAYQRYKVEDREYKNVIASFGPGNGARIVIGAHYDACGETPAADDNASGTAAILELARLLSALKPQLKYRIDLTAYCLEEPPFFRTRYMGSFVHAKSLKDAGVKVRLMISVDMIGYFSTTAEPEPSIARFLNKKTFIPGASTSIIGREPETKIINKLRKYMLTHSHGLGVVPLALPKDTKGVDWSDHMNYWGYNYPAVLISNFFICPNSNYHQPGDTIDHLDFNKIAELVKGLYGIIVEMNKG
ncbi:MAG: M28 family peptidase [bacterium]|nr:M28 family peptidase [bacterium]